MYALDIGAKTELKLPNGQSILLEKGDRLEFILIEEKEEKDTISEERFLTRTLYWENDSDFNSKYAIIQSKFLDRVDSAHLSPDMYSDRRTTIQVKYLEITQIAETNMVKLRIATQFFYDLPEALDIVFVRANDRKGE